MRDCKSLAEWPEAKGNPWHGIAPRGAMNAPNAAGALTLEDALIKRNEVRDRRRQCRKNDETPLAILDAEYDWGYWDAVITVMNNCGIKTIDRKAVQ